MGTTRSLLESELGRQSGSLKCCGEVGGRGTFAKIITTPRTIPAICSQVNRNSLELIRKVQYQSYKSGREHTDKQRSKKEQKK